MHTLPARLRPPAAKGAPAGAASAARWGDMLATCSVQGAPSKVVAAAHAARNLPRHLGGEGAAAGGRAGIRSCTGQPWEPRPEQQQQQQRGARAWPPRTRDPLLGEPHDAGGRAARPQEG